MRGWGRRSVLFGSSIGSICRGMTKREVSHLFRRCLVCVRAYVPATGERAIVLCTNLLQKAVLLYLTKMQTLPTLQGQGC